jgi:hypothetical protein
MESLSRAIATVGVWGGIGYAISASGSAALPVALFLAFAGTASTYFIWGGR